MLERKSDRVGVFRRDAAGSATPKQSFSDLKLADATPEMTKLYTEADVPRRREPGGEAAIFP